ncbi:hypothetical protein Cfor_03826 [Coptotermes formosanus]|uniref:FYVE-type domain-containing protein n=1 Tax=Coptotermes formosanus TaxID=36987 RepID=A0A6L2Q907_COPFO|nr:hypothetical protein Cfor_03826 [Coptotermes formosanus]
MSCHGCACKFTLFNKENGCPNCGFSYCSKCLKLKTAVPKSGNLVCKVCKSCYAALSESGGHAKSPKEEYCPPESLLKRLESLENPSRPPITLYRNNQRMQQLKVGLNEVDRDIVERLEKLREERKQHPLPTEEEVAKRLAVLKGEDPANKASLLKYVSCDARSSQEKADSLVQQLLEEHELDSKQPDVADEIAQRLARLRGQDTSSSHISTGEKKILTGSTFVEREGNLDSLSVDDVNALIVQMEKEVKDSVHQMKELNRDTKHYLKATKSKVPPEIPAEEGESSNEEVEATIQKAVDEVALEEKLDDDSEDNEKEVELPWCIICNEDATVMCLDCDNDLYCKSCFSQGHDEWQLQHHRNVPFAPKK